MNWKEVKTGLPDKCCRVLVMFEWGTFDVAYVNEDGRWKYSNSTTASFIANPEHITKWAEIEIPK